VEQSPVKASRKRELDRASRDRGNDGWFVASCAAVFLVIVACAAYFVVKLAA
jgi:hypothetical protein